nr:MAG TPA: hypothetical protein [Caudoviricetes sp.]
MSPSLILFFTKFAYLKLFPITLLNSHFLCIFAHTRYVFIFFSEIFNPPSRKFFTKIIFV